MKRWWSVPAWWLLGPATLFAISVVACDVIENRKFDPPTGTVIGTMPTPSRGFGGYGYGGSSTPFGSGGAGGGGGSSISLDAGSRTSPCGIPQVGTYCVTTCFTDMPATQSAICEPVSGTWMCAAGWQLASACPTGSCVNTTQICCNHSTGTLMRPPCLASGVLDICPTGWDPSFTSTPCLVSRTVDSGSSSVCANLSNQPCTMQSARCTDSSAVCFCQPISGALLWYCAASPGP